MPNNSNPTHYFKTLWEFFCAVAARCQKQGLQIQPTADPKQLCHGVVITDGDVTEILLWPNTQFRAYYDLPFFSSSERSKEASELYKKDLDLAMKGSLPPNRKAQVVGHRWESFSTTVNGVQVEGARRVDVKADDN